MEENINIVRRMDELGRILIPKAIRMLVHVGEGDPMEIWVENDTVCLRKYEPAKNESAIL